ncbi:hypothetical protein DFQ04_1827 [Algoriphagus boseongensis]|uniref:Uncharacterized protein n=1 Tax=Algoriphagus boseongensis TaxID=1442587 RepID=A0A4R6T7G8_9BACT|nr:hypothetical protein [Algoriphagus boseongensis]TDQ17175.1 hypothetical protein DFQ04_1827 [Algoriphagus boseongensis]
MSKLIPIFIEGKKWIQLSQLSFEHAQSLRSMLPGNCLKKIIFHGIELIDCLDFETYEYWFRTKEVSDQTEAVLDF